MNKRVFSALLFVLFLLPAMFSFAQDMKLPADPKLRYGKLDNGLTYYIRYNKLPKGRADFWIAQRVGSILEEDNQRGLAHFLEHMAFNGTKNLPGKTMLNYMESIGIKFGENINAGTGFDETVYYISNIPTNREGVIDTALLVLHDWSSFISLNHDEIDKERGVIHEEWRTRSNAQWRLWEAIFPIIFKGSQYANRMPIGTMEVIDNFSYKELEAYYDKWYRPDLQGIIIVGDIDVDQIEAKIKKLFSDIPKPVNPAERIYYPVPDNAEPIVGIMSDPEATQTTLSLYYKHEPLSDAEKNSMEYFAYSYVTNMISMMLNQRLQDLTQKPNPPFLYGYAFDGDFFVARTKDAWTTIAVCKENGISEALKTIVVENERVKQFGFTASEYERAKADFLKQIETLYNDRENQKNERYTSEYSRNFCDGEPTPGIEFEYMLYNQLANMVPVAAVNEAAKEFISGNNMVVTVTGPKKDGLKYPSESELLKVIQNAENEKVEAYVDAVSNEPLITTLPTPGSVKKESTLPEFGATEWVLSNGAKVIIKPTKFKEDEIVMSGVSWGGTSVLNPADATTIKCLDDLIEISGVGNFSATDLPKVLAGKNVKVTPTVNQLTDRISGDCSPKDLETMLQLVYLYFTQQRTDKDAFASYLSRMQTRLENQALHPMITFSDSVVSVLYKNNPLRTNLKVADLKKINYEKGMEMIKDRFSDIDNFTFTFVGNIDPNTIKPLVEMYLGSITPSHRTESWKDDDTIIPLTNVKREYSRQMETPTVSSLMLYTGKMPYSISQEIYMKAFTDILDIVYTEKVREDESGTYGVSTFGQVKKYPHEVYLVQIFFNTNIEQRDKLIGIIQQEFEDMATKGPRAEDVSKEKEYLLRKHKEDLDDNGYWLDAIGYYNLYNLDKVKDYENIVNGITVKSMQEFAQWMMANKYLKEVIQNPK